LPAAAAARDKGSVGLRGEVLDGRDRPPSLATMLPSAPIGFARIVDALLDPDPSSRPRSAERVVLELERVRRELVGKSGELPPEEIGPFRGLARFERADRDVYFGRSVEVAAALEVLRTRGVLALIGPSGSGKSSLARAGVLPAVEDGALGRWPKAWTIATCSPGADPRAAIVDALAVSENDARDPDRLVDTLAERAQESGRGVLLFVDQLEELVTIASGASQEFAVRVLARMGQAPIPGVRAVVTARRDLLDPLFAVADLGRVLTRATLLVTPMSDDTWGDVLDQALGAYGYALEDAAMRDALLADLEGSANAMPLVQFALRELWLRRDRDRKVVTRKALAEIGGLAGALEAHADATLAEIAKLTGGAGACRRVLLLLTTIDGTRATRTDEELAAAVTGARDVTRVLEDARILVRDAHGLTIAHESLLTRWAALRRWVDEARQDRLLAHEIERDAKAWLERPDRERLWRGRRLVAAEDLVRAYTVELSLEATEFVAYGRRAERRGRALLALALLPLLAVPILAIVAARREITDAKAEASAAAASASASASTREEAANRAALAAEVVRMRGCGLAFADDPRRPSKERVQHHILRDACNRKEWTLVYNADANGVSDAAVEQLGKSLERQLHDQLTQLDSSLEIKLKRDWARVRRPGIAIALDFEKPGPVRTVNGEPWRTYELIVSALSSKGEKIDALSYGVPVDICDDCDDPGAYDVSPK
jgi:type II secretory pathway predicted ATPase ExeA